MTDTVSALGLAAVRLAGAGHPVFPLVPGRKDPLTAHGFHDATTDIVQVLAWWKRWPEANIGGRCGVTFDVLDVDVKVPVIGEPVKDGRPALHRLNMAGLLHGAFGLATTRHGGTHLFYPPSGLGVRHLHRHALDFQGAGSYVVLPPSVVPADDGVVGPGRYSWVDPLDVTRPGSHPLDWQAVARLLDPPKVTAGAAFTPGGGGGGSLAALTRSVRHAAEGTRNRILFWAACRAVSEGHPLDDIERAAVAAGLDGREIRCTLASARKQVQVQA